MARSYISPESQIQRIQILREGIQTILKEPTPLLLVKPDEKRWSAGEVVEHMVLGHAPYRAKIDKALGVLKPGPEWERLRARRVPHMLFQGFTPKEGRIRYKMKTAKIFQPIRLPERATPETLTEVTTDFLDSLDHLQQAASRSRSLEVGALKFSSAIGPVVRFNLSEAIEFILRHNERHLQQIQNTLSSIDQSQRA